MELSIIIPHIEALVFASEKPLTPLEVVELVNNALGFIEDRATLDQVESAVEAIKEKYNSEFYPFELKQSGGGLQFLTKAAYYKTVAQLNGDKFLKRLSTAALETLAIIAYKQPITKGEIESLRGVNCDYAVQKLLEKDLVLITGRKENAPGQPLIYGTSKTFMDYFGINSADELPKLSDIVSSDFVESTTVGASNPVDGDIIAEDKTLLVDENGNIEELLENAEPAVEASAEVFTDNSNEEAEIVVEELSTETIIVETEKGTEEEVHSEDLSEDKTDGEDNKEDKDDKQEGEEAHPEQH
ncbi:MAG: SMC-Scp complex subunit ScpB [Chitinophagaceae bacterium]